MNDQLWGPGGKKSRTQVSRSQKAEIGIKKFFWIDNSRTIRPNLAGKCPWGYVTKPGCKTSEVNMHETEVRLEVRSSFLTPLSRVSFYSSPSNNRNLTNFMLRVIVW